MTIEEMIQRNIDMIDPEIYDLLTYINRVEGIRTTGSCFGHNERPCMVCCEADSIATVHKFMRDYFYNDELWTIRLYITDTEHLITQSRIKVKLSPSHIGEICLLLCMQKLESKLMLP